MASRIMHYAIAAIIAENMKIRDKKKFILGNLEPDISSKKDGSYDMAHFSDVNEVAGTKGINWKRFIAKYKDSFLADEEILGYFCHLITDACWLKLMREKHIRTYTGEKRKELITQGYKDMYAYNAVLVKKFQLKNEVLHITDLKVEEAKAKYKEEFLEGLVADFDADENPGYEFIVYPYEEVMNFIQFVVELAEKEIISLREGNESRNPEEWYVNM